MSAFHFLPQISMNAPVTRVRTRLDVATPSTLTTVFVCQDIKGRTVSPVGNQNGATCSDFANAYYCVCLPGYQGTNCESGR